MPAYVSDLLTATAAPVNAAPTSTRSWQWLRGSTAISGATSSTYTAVTADIGATIAASQIEANVAGTATATSAPTEVIQAFDPIRLFSGSEPGVWYDPNDITTLYKGPTVQAPVTTPGDEVYLMLDKSRGGPGPELVVNGTFPVDTAGPTVTGWTATRGATLSVVSNALRVTQDAVSDYALASQAVSLTVGAWYRLTLNYLGGTASNVQVGVGSNNTSADATFYATSSSAQSITLNFQATATTMYVRASVNVSTNNVYADFDNFSLKAIPGNHATQPTTASQPIYGIVPAGGRRNLLLHSEAFDNAVWIKYQSAVTANAVAAPDGTTTAEKLVPAASVSPGFIYYNGSLAILSIGTVTTASVYVKAAELGFALIANNNNASSVASAACINLSTGALTNQGGSGTYSVVSAGNGWWRVSVTSTSTAAQNSLEVSPLAVAGSYNSYTGNGTSGIYIWGAQIELSATATPYQRVTTQYDVTEAGVASLGYLFFDGSGDFMSTGTITPGTDKVQVFTGLQKLNDTPSRVLVEYGPTVNTSPGSFGIFAPSTASYTGSLNGSAQSVTNIAGFPAPITNVISALYDIAGATIAEESIYRINGVVPAQTNNGVPAGTGNFGNYSLNIGYRPATGLYLWGQLFPLIVRFGPNLTTARISATESWVASKTPGVTL